MSDDLTPDEIVGIIEPLILVAMEAAITSLQEAVGFGLDPASILVGMLLVLSVKKGQSPEELRDFLSKDYNQKILLAAREKVT